MLNDAGVEGDFSEGLWAECASTATYYENLIVDKESKKDPNNLMFNRLLKKPVKHRKFGEMCVSTTKDKIQSELADKGTTCMFVGYGVDHASDVYRFLNPNTERISRDVIRLGKSFGTWTKSRNGVKIDKIYDSDDEEETQKDTKVHDEVDGVDKKKLDKAKREAYNLMSWLNPDPERFVENNQLGRELILDRVNLALNVTGAERT